MSSIDERIVTMQFDNKQFENGVSNTLSSLDKLKNGLNLTESAKNLNELDAAGKKFSLEGIASGVKALSDTFSSFGIIGITVLQNLTNATFNFAKQLASSFTIDPVKAGFADYNRKLVSIQTITNATGKSVEEVNGYFKVLDTYADKTIYNLDDMTSAFAKFTNAGVDLDKSVPAIKGIANMVALAGQDANAAKIAMYNLSQSIAGGFLTTMDYKSLNLANVATKEWKQQMIDGAIAAGTLKKSTNGMYTVKGSDKAMSDMQLFTEGLSEQWATTQVMLDVLGKYGDETTEIGKKAQAAAQDVKSFSMMMDTLKASAGTGWTDTFEILVGDLEEAKDLFTPLTNYFGEILNKSADARNAMLQDWKTLGGRTMLIESITTAFQALVAILKPIKDAFTDIFPPMTGQKLFEFTQGLRELVEHFKIGDERAEKIYEAFKGLFSIVKIGTMAITALAQGVIELIKFFLPAGDMALTLAGRLGMFATDIKNAAEQGDTFTKMLDGVKKALEPVGEFIKSIGDAIAKGLPLFVGFGKAVGDAFDIIMNKIGALFGDKGFNPAMDILNGGLLAVLLVGIKKFIDNLDGAFSIIKGWKESIVDLLSGVKDSLTVWQTSLKAGVLLKIAGAIALLAIALSVLAGIDPKKMASALTAITVLFIDLFGSMLVFDKLAGGKGFKSIRKITKVLIPLAVAVLILAVAVEKLSKIPYVNMINGLTGLGIILFELGVFLKLADFEGIGITKALAIMILAGAMVIMADAIKKLGELSVKQIIKGVGALGMVLTEIGVFMKLTGDTKKVLSNAIAIGILSIAMNIMADAFKKLGELTVKQIIKGVAVLGAVLTEIGVFMKLTGDTKKVLANAVAMTIIAGALLIFGDALKKLGDFTVKQILKSIFMLASILTIIGVAMHFMQSALPGAAALLVISGALLVLAGVLTILGNMTVKQIIKSLGLLAGMFVVLGLATLILAPIIPVMLLLAVTMTVFGIAITVVSAGVLLFATALTALSIALTAGSVAIVVLVTSLIGLIPMLLVKIGEGIIAFAQTIANGSTAIAAAVQTVAIAIINTIVTVIPAVVAALLTFIVTMLEELAVSVPKMVDSGMKLILGILKGIADNIQQVTEAGIEVILEFIRGVVAKLPDIIDTAFTVIITFINGLADAIRKNKEIMAQAALNLVTALVEAVLSLISTVINLGKSIITGFIKGVKDMAGKLWDEGVEIGKNIINGMTNGIKSMAGNLFDSAMDVVRGAIDGVKNFLGIRSPSRLAMGLGEYFDQGFINGLTNLAGKVGSAALGVGNEALDGVKYSMGKIIDVIDSDADFNPTIRPVLDMSDVDAGLSSMDKNLSRGRSMSVTASANAARAADYFKKREFVDGTAGVSTTNNPTSTYIFNQTNNSPKALSRIEIYRQTHNQFAALKGLVENT